MVIMLRLLFKMSNFGWSLLLSQQKVYMLLSYVILEKPIYLMHMFSRQFSGVSLASVSRKIETQIQQMFQMEENTRKEQKDEKDEEMKSR